MSPQSILIISLIAGLAGLLSGTFITYSRYIKNKSYLLSQIDRAENELAHDLMDVTSGELIKTHSGKELHLILINEKNESADRFNSYEDILFDKQTAKDSASRNGESSKDAATEQLFNTNIVLLGAPGSGKTWLLNAFHKELSLMGKSDPNFDYLLEDVGNNFLFTKSERTHIAPSTPDLKSNFLYFERRSK
jgi:predicted ATPase